MARMMLVALALAPFVQGLPVHQVGLPDPYLVPLRREEVAVTRDGKTIAYKTSYSGKILVGGSEEARQEFRVVFDTGSGHVILPSRDCVSETCLLHERYDINKSPGAVAVNVDSSPVPEDEPCDQVTIGFGTGNVVGEFVKDHMCVGTCVQMNLVSAVEMSEQPFKSFAFDGIVGLGLQKLSLSPAFSFLSSMEGSLQQTGHPTQFGIFLTENDQEGESELSLGGTNFDRFHGQMLWAKVSKPQLGHWQVSVKAMRIGNRTIVDCSDGSCQAIVDTGTSHFGIPAQHEQEVGQLLSVLAHEDTDCLNVHSPTVEIDIDDFTLTLPPANYMRKLPLHDADIANELTVDASRDPLECKPKLMPVSMQPPMGPNLFILGEPVLHRYYTAYDWGEKKIGFARRHKLNALTDGKDLKKPAASDVVLLVQVVLELNVARRSGMKNWPAMSDVEQEGLHPSLYSP